jgi:regulator of cell morphogenesis and NO signaling
MTITASTTVAEIATANPATIRVFQRHRIDFCCGGRIPLADACEQHQLEPAALVAELEAATLGGEASRDWSAEPLSELVVYIQTRFHRPLEAELPRLRAMINKVVSRHGTKLPEVLLPLQRTFFGLERELVSHMAREDSVLFPAVVSLARGERPAGLSDWTWIEQPIEVMEAEHATVGSALAYIAGLTGGYVPPADACPTFRGLYFGLAELEREMHVHVHLENHVLFPRAAALARDGAVKGGR